jgi:hypothetical protein
LALKYLPRVLTKHTETDRDKTVSGMAFSSLHCTNPEPLMSALGQKRTFPEVETMSALPPKADID